MTKSDKQRFNRKRFKALIALIVAKSERPLSKEKLHWLLFHCDMESYAKFGKSITGATWVKGRKYPVPHHF